MTRRGRGSVVSRLRRVRVPYEAPKGQQAWRRRGFQHRSEGVRFSLPLHTGLSRRLRHCGCPRGEVSAFQADESEFDSHHPLRIEASRWPNGKAADCNSAVRRFDSDSRLHALVRISIARLSLRRWTRCPRYERRLRKFDSSRRGRGAGGDADLVS